MVEQHAGGAKLSSSLSTSSFESESEEVKKAPAPSLWSIRKTKLSKQLSLSETTRDNAWERRRRQILRQEKRRSGVPETGEDLTDEDLSELKGSIELGFGFNEEEGQKLCNTLPALDLYFAVNRHFSPSPLASPNSSSTASSISASASASSSSTSLADPSLSLGSPRGDSDSWKICSAGDDPELVKTKLRHWAQAVACSVMQSY